MVGLSNILSLQLPQRLRTLLQGPSHS